MCLVDKTAKTQIYQLVIIYASSGCPLKELVVDLKELLHPEMTTIIVGDFNFDKNDVNVLTRFLGKRKFSQVIDWPTHKEGRTIDHCYVSNNAKVKVTKHSPYYSDHNALCIQYEDSLQS